jgi:hypothetical protein
LFLWVPAVPPEAYYQGAAYDPLEDDDDYTPMEETELTKEEVIAHQVAWPR